MPKQPYFVICWNYIFIWRLIFMIVISWWCPTAYLWNYCTIYTSIYHTGCTWFNYCQPPFYRWHKVISQFLLRAHSLHQSSWLVFFIPAVRSFDSIHSCLFLHYSTSWKCKYTLYSNMHNNCIYIFPVEVRIWLVCLVCEDAELLLHGDGFSLATCGHDTTLLALYWIHISRPHNRHAWYCTVHQSHSWEGQSTVLFCICFMNTVDDLSQLWYKKFARTKPV